MIPPIASEPYKALEEPRTISILSISFTFNLSNAQELVNLAVSSPAILFPSTKIKIWFLLIPRICTLLPTVPERTVTSCANARASCTVVAPRSCISCAVITSVACGIAFISSCVRLAVTTTSDVDNFSAGSAAQVIGIATPKEDITMQEMIPIFNILLFITNSIFTK